MPSDVGLGIAMAVQWNARNPERIRLRIFASIIRVEAAATRLRLGLKAGFRPDQPRVPTGQPGGGQWTDEFVILVGRARSGGRPSTRVGNRWLPTTPAQEVRLEISRNAMRKAVRDVNKLDPNWRPTPQMYATVEGQIKAFEAIRLQAELRIFEVSGHAIRLGPYAREWIQSPVTGKRLTRKQQSEVDGIGRKYGCHGCGSKEPGTRSGSFFGDHQMPKSLGNPKIIVPHCSFCSSSQGGLVLRTLRRNKRDN